MDVLDGVPRCILGYQVKTRTQIVFSFLIPVIFELLVYTVVITADVLVVVEHFRNGNPAWAWFSLIFMWLPAIACFSAVLSSPSQWPEEVGFDERTLRFVERNLLVLVFFPVAAVYRLVMRLGMVRNDFVTIILGSVEGFSGALRLYFMRNLRMEEYKPLARSGRHHHSSCITFCKRSCMRLLRCCCSCTFCCEITLSGIMTQ